MMHALGMKMLRTFLILKQRVGQKLAKLKNKEGKSNHMKFKHCTLKQATGSGVEWSTLTIQPWTLSMNTTVAPFQKERSTQKQGEPCENEVKKSQEEGVNIAKRQESYLKMLFQRLTVNLYPHLQKDLCTNLAWVSDTSKETMRS